MGFSIEDAKKMNILNVAHSLDMTMIKSARNEYCWQEHDSFKINTDKNLFNWFSRGIGGDVIQMVQTVKDVDFKEAMKFLETGNFETVEIKEEIKVPFVYHLNKYETDFAKGREYLKEVRGLSDDTINFFLEKDLLALVNRTTKDGYSEPVIVFKYFNDNEVIGGSLQGIIKNKDRYERGYLKQIMYNSDNTAGFSVEIGNKVEELIFFEAPIDLMSYYELNKESLHNCKLIAMDGLKDVVIARYVTEHILKNSEEVIDVDFSNSNKYLDFIIKRTTFFDEEKNKSLVKIAVDNDDAGRNFVEKLRERGISLVEELPKLDENINKVDWNDVLVNKKNILAETRRKEREDLNQDSLQFETEGSTTPVPEKSTFYTSVTKGSTISSRLLHFSIKEGFKSSKVGSYHYIRESELEKLNRRAGNIQHIAKFYKNNLADTKISYFTSSGNLVRVDFKSEHFMHLIGIKAIGEGQTPEKTLFDLVEGNGRFYNIQLSNQGATFEKINALLDLETILDTKAIYFDGLDTITRYKGRFNSIIKSDDKDIMILFRTINQEETIPVSVFKARGIHNKELKNANRNTILGIYREKNGKIEQLSVNDKYIKDNGKEMMDILLNNRLEKVSEDVAKNEIKSSFYRESIKNSNGIVLNKVQKELIDKIKDNVINNGKLLNDDWLGRFNQFNHNTQKQYNSINLLLLAISSSEHNYKSNLWLTAKQISYYNKDIQEENKKLILNDNAKPTSILNAIVIDNKTNKELSYREINAINDIEKLIESGDYRRENKIFEVYNCDDVVNSENVINVKNTFELGNKVKESIKNNIGNDPKYLLELINNKPLELLRKINTAIINNDLKLNLKIKDKDDKVLKENENLRRKKRDDLER